MTALDPRFAALFTVDRRRRRVALVRPFVFVALALILGLYLRFWVMWVAFGVVALLAGVALFIAFLLGVSTNAVRAGLEADLRELAWIHSPPGPRANRRLVELHDDHDRVAYLWVRVDLALAAVEAARTLPHQPTITTTEQDHAAATNRHRLAGKLRRLELAARHAVAPELSRQRPIAERAIGGWWGLLFQPPLDPYRDTNPARQAGPLLESARWHDLPVADLEARVDRLLLLYDSASRVEGHRMKMARAVAAKNLPHGIIDRELFTDEISRLLVELRPKVG